MLENSYRVGTNALITGFLMGGGGDGMGLGILFKSLSKIFINHKLLIRLFP